MRKLDWVALTAFRSGPAGAQRFRGDRIGSCSAAARQRHQRSVENQQIDCMYRDDAEGAVPAHYVGTLTRSPQCHDQRSWRTRLGRRRRHRHVGPGALAGNYGPVSAKVGVGGGGAALVGGSNNTFSLQPFNIQAGSGVGWTAASSA